MIFYISILCQILIELNSDLWISDEQLYFISWFAMRDQRSRHFPTLGIRYLKFLYYFLPLVKSKRETLCGACIYVLWMHCGNRRIVSRARGQGGMPPVTRHRRAGRAGATSTMTHAQSGVGAFLWSYIAVMPWLNGAFFYDYL